MGSEPSDRVNPGRGEKALVLDLRHVLILIFSSINLNVKILPLPNNC